MESVEEVKRKCKEKESRFGKRYGFEFKLRCVKLQLEEGLPFSLLSKEVGASADSIRSWVKAYRERGEEGFRNPVRLSGGRRKLPGPVRVKPDGEMLKIFPQTLGAKFNYSFMLIFSSWPISGGEHECPPGSEHGMISDRVGPFLIDLQIRLRGTEITLGPVEV